MLQPLCPTCGAATVHTLDGVSPTATVTYYRCGDCWHVWTAETNAASAQREPLRFPERSQIQR